MSNDILNEHGWERWHDWQADVMAPVTTWFLDAIDARPGLTVLDAACGTGLPAIAVAAAVAPTGRVIATDVAPELLAAAGRRATAAGVALDLRRMDLAALDLPDGAVDAATCKDGLMYVDPVAGARELRRVVRPGGAVAVTAWDEPACNPFFTTLFGTAARFAPGPAPDPTGPGPFRLARPGALVDTLRAAGFTDVTLARRELTWTFDSVEQHWRAVRDLAAPVARAAAQLAAPDLARLRDALADALRPFLDGGAVRIPAVAQCAVARA